jgi:enoyl-CoA hydratase/carnithine racemase
MESLFELESLLAWCTTKIEIQTIFLQSTTSTFSLGYNPRILKKLTIEKLQKFTQKLQKINQAIMLLPQTVIVDMQLGTENIASELALACDIRIANRSCSINFNHSKLGLVPCSGGMAQLSHIVGHANAKNWILTGDNIPLRKLEASGLVYIAYTMDTRDEVVQNLLESIRQQSPVQRIQTKLGVVENIRVHIENMLTFENQIAKAAMITEDWKNEHDTLPMKAKNMKAAVKLSLIKSDNNLPN